MGIIGDFIGDVAIDAVGKVLDTTIDVLDAKSTAKRRKLFKCPSGEKALLIQKEQRLLRDKFNVYDENENVVYSVRGKFVSAKTHLRIYDAQGKEIGTVKRGHNFLRTNPIFDFIIYGRKAGSLWPVKAMAKRKYLLDNGWSVEGNFLGLKYNIIVDGKPVATIASKFLSWGDTYLIRFQEGANDLLILMIVLAVDSATMPSRTEKVKDAFRLPGEDDWDE